MKFYYNGKLIRTSKTQVYKYAIIWNDRCIACSANLATIRSRYNTEMNHTANNLELNEAVLNAKLEGKPTFTYKGETRKTKHYQDDFYSIESLKKLVEGEKRDLADYYANAKIVELEAR